MSVAAPARTRHTVVAAPEPEWSPWARPPRRRWRGRLGIQSKLLAMLLAVSVLSALVTGPRPGPTSPGGSSVTGPAAAGSGACAVPSVGVDDRRERAVSVGVRPAGAVQAHTGKSLLVHGALQGHR